MKGNNKDKGATCQAGGIFDLKNADKYNTVEELFKNSQPTSVYYTLLTLSSVIVACGLLLNNATIVIGGMLVTPLLTPLLLVALGINVGETSAIRCAAILFFKSALSVVAISFLLAVVLEGADKYTILDFGDSLRLAVLYFIVALVAGAAATFAWARKEVADILPGIAVAVSLVPPLAMIGIYLGSFDFASLRMVFFIFILNLIGVVLGSMTVFSLLKFHKAEKVIKKEAANHQEIIDGDKDK